MIKVYTGIKGFAASFFFTAGLVFFIFILFWGFTKTIELILPLLIVVAYLLIIVFVLGFLPATLIRDLRPSLCRYSDLMSRVLGGATWVMSFFFVIKVFGFWGVFIAFFVQFLAPIALVAAVVQSSWHIADHLALWMSFTYGIKFYSHWLASLIPQERKKGDIIDVDAVEVEESGKD
jgi:hypothetical protein